MYENKIRIYLGSHSRAIVSRNKKLLRGGIEACIKSIRKYLPKAEIIVSTWENESLDNLDFDLAIKNRDPGSDSKGNVTRQIISTYCGIQISTRPYILKFRANFSLKNSKIARLECKVKEGFQGSRFKFLDLPITTTNLFLRNPRKIPLLFHISDLVLFGKKNDMEDLWRIKIGKSKRDALIKKILPYAKERAYVDFCPEQIIALKWLYTHKIVPNLEHSRATSKSLIKMWEKILVINFHIVDFEKSGINFGFTYHKEDNLFTAKEINELRKSFIDSKYIPSADQEIFHQIMLKTNELKNKLNRKLILLEYFFLHYSILFGIKFILILRRIISK